MDLIRIKGLELDCIVGLRPFEREREQRVHIDLALGLDLSPAGRTGRIALTCDYDRIAEEVIAMLRFRRYHLIEAATEELCAMLLGAHPPIEWVEIKLDKPGALDGRARAASVEVRRARAALESTRHEAPWGTVENLLSTREAGLYRLRVDAGATLPGPFARGERELEWLISGELARDGVPLERDVPDLRAEDAACPSYENHGTAPAILFRCVCPPVFDAS